jgi:hypothetical protein
MDVEAKSVSLLNSPKGTQSCWAERVGFVPLVNRKPCIAWWRDFMAIVIASGGKKSASVACAASQ